MLVTSRRPGTLLEELKEWRKISLDDLKLKAGLFNEYGATIAGGQDTHGGMVDHLTHLCPIEYENVRIRESLNRLATMDVTSLRVAIRLLQDHTGWPENPSLDSLTRFADLLDRITPHDTPQKVLDRILRSNDDKDGLCWILNWLLCGYRPLSRSELTAILHHHRRQWQQEQGLDLPNPASPAALKEIRCQLVSWLRGLAEFSHDQVTVRDEIQVLLKDDTETERYIWNEVRPTAHQRIAEFCLAYVALASTQSLLDSMFQKYESQVHQQQQQLAAPIIPDGKELAFYTVQSLPYHLSKCPGNYATKALRPLLEYPTAKFFGLWAKVYWAMSNPFSRAPIAPESALPVLTSLGLLSYENIKEATELSRAQCLIAAAGNKRVEIVVKLLEEGTISILVLVGALVAAIMAGDEATALKILASRALSLAEHDSDELVSHWPQSLIWAAAWLNMAELVGALLSSGASRTPLSPYPPASSAPRSMPTVIYVQVPTRPDAPCKVRLILLNVSTPPTSSP